MVGGMESSKPKNQESRVEVWNDRQTKAGLWFWLAVKKENPSAIGSEWRPTDDVRSDG